VVESDRLFVACPRCSAWPMAANVDVLNWHTRREIRFRCPRCGHQVTAKAPARETNHAETEATVDRRG
jgi:DNA-directed RNA polymerase subunit RPC12/RpoP